MKILFGKMPIREKLRQFILSLALPVIYLTFIIIVLKNGQAPQIDQPRTDQFVLLALAAVSLIIFIWSQFLVRPTLYLTPRKAKRLITTGPYRFVRHPTYVSLLVFCVSISLLLKAHLAFWYTLFIIGPINLGRAIWEEKILLESFGKKYQDYREKTLI